MREAIRQRLLDAIPELGGRAYDLHEDVSTADKPYLVIVQGPDAYENGWTGHRRTFEIWPYVGLGEGFGAVDGLADAVVQALDERTLTGPPGEGTFLCRYSGTAEGDRKDEAKTAITRGIRFSVWGLPDAGTADATDSDSWLTALGNWSAAWLGGDWRVHLNAWPRDLTKPAVLWRIQSIETLEGDSAAYETRKRVIGHFLGVSRNKEMAAVYEAIGRLQAGTKIALDPHARTWLKVADLQADLSADRLTAGQLAITLSKRMSRAPAAAPLMRQVRIYS